MDSCGPAPEWIPAAACPRRLLSGGRNDRHALSNLPTRHTRESISSNASIEGGDSSRAVRQGDRNGEAFADSTLRPRPGPERSAKVLARRYVQ